MTGHRWDTPLARAVGEKTAKVLAGLDLHTVGDLLEHYPRRFIPRGETSSAEDFRPGEQVTVVAEVRSATAHPYQDKRTRRTAYRTEVRCRFGGTEVWMTFFDSKSHTAQWRTTQLAPGKRVLAAGKVTRNSYKQDRWELTHPQYDVDIVDRDLSALQPIYPATAKVSSWIVETAVGIVLEAMAEFPDRLPADLRERHALISAEQAFRWIHRPEDWSQLGAATKRLKFDEALVAQVTLARRRRVQQEQVAVARPGRDGGLLDAFTARLPFELTAGQRRVEAEILADLSRPHPMHRLLQGEVGSGKTVLALRAMLQVVDSGAQAALLAPTEVLAQQHHRSTTRMLGDLAAGGMLGGAEDATRVALLTGSLPAAARKQALLDIASGEAGIVIGTHALLQDRVSFAELGLVVVDEQHRFGVEQRAALGARNADQPPHVLVMTATPIPRTVAMTVFGDLETSALTELPAGRAPIQTVVVPLADQPGWWPRVWSRVAEEVASGRQAYVVCPRITGDEQSAEDDGDEPPEDDADGGGSTTRALAAVEEVAPGLREGSLAGLRVEALHGRLDADSKDAVMSAFAAGEIDVLVSTTVIEVGVDVGNATTMVVLDADRFGISQLHQLRGRVGRGGHPGLCLLVTAAPIDTPARTRLDAVASTLDGFELADLDLEQRREGDVLGTAQSGRQGTLRLLSVRRDVDVITEAREAATALVGRDPDLAEAPALRASVLALEESARSDYLDKT